MNLRWLVFDYVDPALTLTRRERGEIRRRSRQVAIRKTSGRDHVEPNVSYRVLMLLAFVLLVSTSVILVLMWILASGRWAYWWVLALQILDGFAIWIILAIIGQWKWQPHVIVALRELGHDVCGHCGYWLAHMPAIDRCPECGTLREPPSQELCKHCGYWLRGLGDEVKRCPECGANREPMQVDQEP